MSKHVPALVLLLVLAVGVPAAWAAPVPASRRALVASVGGLGGLGLGSHRSAAGLELALWRDSGPRSSTRTYGLGVDAGWTSKAEYAELEASVGFSPQHDGEYLVGLAAGPVHDRAGRRWGGQATAFAAVVPCFIFPYVRGEMFAGAAPAVSIGLMLKVLFPVYPWMQP